MKKAKKHFSLFLIAFAALFSMLVSSCKHEHKFASSLSFDETSHWNKATCKHSDVKGNLSEHVFDNACDTTCNVCNAERSTSHNIVKTYVKNETHHWYECSVCKVKQAETAHLYVLTEAKPEYLVSEATEVSSAKYYKSCVCGSVGTEIFEVTKQAPTFELEEVEYVFNMQVPTLKYKTNSNGEIKFSYKMLNSEEAYQSGIEFPIVGEYSLKAEIAETIDFASATFFVNFKIVKAPLNFKMSDMEDIIYGDEIGFPEMSVNEIIDIEDLELLNPIINLTRNGEDLFENPRLVGKYVYSVEFLESDCFLADKATIEFEIFPKELDLTRKFTTVYNGTNEHTIALTQEDGIVFEDIISLKLELSSKEFDASVLSFNLEGSDVSNYVIKENATIDLTMEKITLDALQNNNFELYEKTEKIVKIEDEAILEGDEVFVKVKSGALNYGTHLLSASELELSSQYYQMNLSDITVVVINANLLKIDVESQEILTGRGLLIKGKVVNGTLEVGDEVMEDGRGEVLIVGDLKVNNEGVNSASKGDSVELVVRGKNQTIEQLKTLYGKTEGGVSIIKGNMKVFSDDGITISIFDLSVERRVKIGDQFFQIKIKPLKPTRTANRYVRTYDGDYFPISFEIDKELDFATLGEIYIMNDNTETALRAFRVLPTLGEVKHLEDENTSICMFCNLDKAELLNSGEEVAINTTVDAPKYFKINVNASKLAITLANENCTYSVYTKSGKLLEATENEIVINESDAGDIYIKVTTVQDTSATLKVEVLPLI